MTQKMIDTIFSLTITIHEQEWFGKRSEPLNRDKVQEWVTKQLADIHQIYTIPIGAKWGVITTHEQYHAYWADYDWYISE